MIKISRPHFPFNISEFILFLFLSIPMVFFSGCSPGRILQEPSEPIELGDILVIPFQNLNQSCGIDGSFRCPFFGSMHQVGEVREGADEFLTDLLFSKLKNEKKLNLIEPGQALGARSTVLSESPGELSEKELVLEVARLAGAQSVIFGRIFQYRERVGTGFSVDKPASAAFDILLLRVSDGKLQWSGQFEETQKSLSENLFLIKIFFKRNARWLTVDELAEFGLDDILKTFPESM